MVDTYSHLAQLRMTITPALEHLYAALNFTSIVLLVLLGGTVVWSKRLKRDPTLLNAFVVIVFVDFVNVLYYLVRRGDPLDSAAGGQGGGQAGGDLPARGVCRAQASLGAGSQAAQASAVFAVCLQLWITLMQLDNDWFYRLKTRWTTGLLLALPWLCIIAFIPPMVVATGQTPELLTPSPFYCSLEDGTLRSVYSKLALVFSALCLVLELHLIYLVLRRFRQTTKLGPSLSPQSASLIDLPVSLAPSRRSISLAFALRVAVFMVWTMSMMVATLYQAFDESSESPVSDLVFACVGPLAFICFASQPDILRVWGWRKVARWWSTAKRARSRGTPEREREDHGWSDFLGRDDSDTTLSTLVDAPDRDVERGLPGVPRTGRIDENDVMLDDKSPSPSTSPLPTRATDRDRHSNRDSEGGDVNMDLLAALDRGPSR